MSFEYFHCNVGERGDGESRCSKVVRGSLHVLCGRVLGGLFSSPASLPCEIQGSVLCCVQSYWWCQDGVSVRRSQSRLWEGDEGFAASCRWARTRVVLGVWCGAEFVQALSKWRQSWENSIRASGWRMHLMQLDFSQAIASPISPCQQWTVGPEQMPFSLRLLRSQACDSHLSVQWGVPQIASFDIAIVWELFYMCWIGETAFVQRSSQLFSHKSRFERQSETGNFGPLGVKHVIFTLGCPLGNLSSMSWRRWTIC